MEGVVTIGEDRPSLSDFPRVIPQHQCWRNGGVECRACEIEEQRAEEELDAFCGLRFEGNVCDRPTGHAGACYDESTRVAFEDGWWADDRCTHGTSWTDPRGGQGSWRSTPPHLESLTDLLVAFIVCLLAGIVFVGAVVAGRAVMCQTHEDAQGRPTLSYCDGYER